MASAWHAGDTGIQTVWRIWLRDMPAAEEALIAARATRLAYDAECGVQHSEPASASIDLAQFASKVSRPTSRDLRDIWHLHCFALGLEGTLRDLNGFGDYMLPDGTSSLGIEQEGRLDEWKLGFHRVAYRCLIAGAALSRAYSEPIYKSLGETAMKTKSLTDEQHEELAASAVFNSEATVEEQDAVFGPLAQWLLQSILADETGMAAMMERFDEQRGRARCCRDVRRQYDDYDDDDDVDEDEDDGSCPFQLLSSNTSTDSHARAHFVAWQVMQMLWQQHHILDSIYRPPLPYDRGIGSSEKGGIIIAPFGLFSCADVTILTPPSRYAPRKSFTARAPAVSKRPMTIDVFRSISNSMEAAEDDDEEAEDEDEEGAEVPLPLQFFKYFLQRHLGVSFWDGFFATGDPFAVEAQQDWDAFTRCLTLFSLDDEPNREPAHGLDEVAGADFLDGTEFLVRAAS